MHVADKVKMRGKCNKTVLSYFHFFFGERAVDTVSAANPRHYLPGTKFLGVEQTSGCYLHEPSSAIPILAIRAGNVSGASAAGDKQHRVHGQFGITARYFQPVVWHRAPDTLSTEEMSYGGVTL